jgi:hypothetical protein
MVLFMRSPFLPKPLSSVKRDRIENQLRQGVGISEIARNCRVSRSTVYAIKDEVQPKPPPPLAERTTASRSELPWHVVKAMNHGFLHTKPEDQMTLSECTSCKRAMWTNDPKLEDLCEECFFIQHDEVAVLNVQRDYSGMGSGFDGGEGLF